MTARFLPLALVVSLAAAAPLQAGKPDAWIQGHSKHFYIISNAKPKEVQEFTQALEDFRHLLATMFPKLRYNPPAPAVVIFFKDAKSFALYEPSSAGRKPTHVGGFMQPGRERMYLAVNLDAPEARETSQHEFTHLILELNFGEVPVWLNEGLAEFYERTKIDGAEFTMGEYQPGWWDLLQQEKLLPLDVLVRADYRKPEFAVEKKRNLLYAESWLLVHYLMVADEGKRRHQFAQFMLLLLQGTDDAAAFQQALGTDFRGMERQLHDYLQRSSLTYFRGKMAQPAARETVAFAPLETPVAQAYLADLWLSRGELEKAEQSLRPLADAGTAPPEVLARLGRIALQRGRNEEAEHLLDAAVAARPDDIGARYYNAWAIAQSRLAKAASQEERKAAANRIVELLAPVLTDPNPFPDALELLLQARMARDDPPAELIPLVEQARRLRLKESGLTMMLASLYERAERWEEAERLLRGILQQSEDPEERRQAESWLNELRWRRDRSRARLRPRDASEEEAPESVEHPSARDAQPIEPPSSPAPVGPPPEVRYLRGTLVDVACSGDTAVLTIATKEEKGRPARVIHLAVRSLSKVLVFDPTKSGQKLDCGEANVPVTINYRVEPQGEAISGVVMTIEFYPP